MKLYQLLTEAAQLVAQGLGNCEVEIEGYDGRGEAIALLRRAADFYATEEAGKYKGSVIIVRVR